MSTCPGCGGPIDAQGFCDDCWLRVVAPGESSESPPGLVGSAGDGDPGAPGSRGPSYGASGAYGSSSSAEDAPDDPDGDLLRRLLVDPVLPEPHRWCRNRRCREPVGRTTVRRAGLVDGFCRACGWGYSCRPPLQPDPETGVEVVVAGRYRVLGAIGRGGLGWVYLARDQRIPRWVVLKGLLDPDAPGRRALAREELEALAEAEHPNIVAVHDFVEHRHRPRGRGEPVTIDYIVMACIRGESLLERYQRAAGRLSIETAVELLVPAMRAVGYLHSHDLVHNDVKPANVLIDGETGRVFLVDLGAVTHVGGAPSYGTRGYRDPRPNPRSAQTDIYAIARTLAVVTMPVPGFAREEALPGPATEQLLARHPSFHGVLRRATDPDPARRFVSVDEFIGQLDAVVREVAAVERHERRPGLSELFAPEVHAAAAQSFPGRPADRPRWALALPEPIVELAGRHARRLGALRAAPPRELLAAVAALDEPTNDTALLALRARIELLADRVAESPPAGQGPPRGVDGPRWTQGWEALVEGRTEQAGAAFAAAGDARSCPALAVMCAVVADHDRIVAELEAVGSSALDPHVPWLRGLAALVVGAVGPALERFDEVLWLVPGEAAPKLAIALCCELRGDRARAADLYEVVWRTDRRYVSAAFGWARILMAGDDPGEAVRVLSEVPETSPSATAATLAALAAADEGVARDATLAPGFFRRAERLDRGHPQSLQIDDRTRESATVDALRTAMAWTDRRPWPESATSAGASEADPGRPTKLLGLPLEPRALRQGLESAYRRLASQTRDRARRVELVDQANRERSWRLW